MKKMYKPFSGVLISIIGCFCVEEAKAQVVDYSVHANMLYRFTKYIDWPEESKKGDFVIAVIGDSPVYGELKNIAASKHVNSRRIVVKKLSSLQNCNNCNMIYISAGSSTTLKKVIAA